MDAAWAEQHAPERATVHCSIQAVGSKWHGGTKRAFVPILVIPAAFVYLLTAAGNACIDATGHRTSFFRSFDAASIDSRSDGNNEDYDRNWDTSRDHRGSRDPSASPD
ncbi:hypothetical protein V8E36_002240 [Tilletia maclaganii]